MLVKAFLLALAVAAAICDINTYPGIPVNIWSLAPADLEINTNELDAIFGHKDVAGRNIVSFAIDGAKDEGKTLFMDYLLRYMYKNVSFINYRR